MPPPSGREREAFEEAGVTGCTNKLYIGLFSYEKSIDREPELPCVAAIFPLRLKAVLNEYREMQERQHKWFSVEKAAKNVQEPELAAIIEAFNALLLR